MLQIRSSEDWLGNINRTAVGTEEGRLHTNGAGRSRERGGALPGASDNSSDSAKCSSSKLVLCSQDWALPPASSVPSATDSGAY